MKHLLLFCGFLLLSNTPTWAVNQLPREEQLVERAEAIAIVEFEEPAPNGTDQFPDPFKAQGAYGIKASAKTLSVLKGKLPETFEFHGGETAGCGPCMPAKGRTLVFLKKDGDKWVGAFRGPYALRPIVNGRTGWYPLDASFELVAQDEAKVIARVKRLITQSSK
jgi:hypothetical protein